MFKSMVVMIIALHISSTLMFAQAQSAIIQRNCTEYMPARDLPYVEIKILIDKMVSMRTKTLEGKRSTVSNQALVKQLEDLLESISEPYKSHYLELLEMFQKEAAQSVTLTESK